MTHGMPDDRHLLAALAVEWKLLTADQAHQLLDADECRDSEWLLQRMAGVADLSPADLAALRWMARQTQSGRQSGGLGPPGVDTTTVQPQRAPRPNLSSAVSTPPPPGKDHSPAADDQDRYVRKEFHARGGNGQIWRARDHRFGRDVALKELQPDRSHRQSQQRFMTEARVTGQLEHPGIVPVYELHESDTRPFYTMRFIQGDTLQEAISAFHKLPAGSERSLKFVELLNAFIAVCNTVHYAHSHGVIHRDLKGRNVVLGEFGEVVVLDWGVARLLDDEPHEDAITDRKTDPEDGTQDGAIVGTPSYMSPEQARGDNKAVGPASDVYSLGVILYELLAGRLPFEADYVSQLLEKVIALNPARPSYVKERVPRGLEAVCLKALSKQADDRYASARELGDEIRRFLADEPVGCLPDRLPTRLGRWARRHRPIVATAASLVCFLLIGLSAGSWLLADANQRINAEKLRAEELAVEADNEKNNAQRLALEANRNFEEALDSVNQFYNVVSEHRLLHSPQLSLLREDLLQHAMSYYARFSAKDTTDPRLQRLLMEARYRMARISIVRGHHEQALGVLRDCLDWFEAAERQHSGSLPSAVIYAKVLAAIGEIESRQNVEGVDTKYRERGIRLLVEHLKIEPHDADALVKLSQLLTDRAHHYYSTRHVQRAAEPIAKAVDIARQLCAGDNVERHQIQLAETLSFAAVVARDSGQISAAEDHFQEAIEIYGSIRRDAGLIPRERDGLSQCYHSLGVLLRRTGRSHQAFPLLQSSAELRRALADEYPTLPEHRSALSLTYTSIGVLHWHRRDYESAEAAYLQAAELLDQLVTQYPQATIYRNDQAASHNNLAMVYRAQGRTEAAIASYQKCITIREELLQRSAEVLGVSMQLGKCYCNLGHLYQTIDKPATALRWQNEAVKLLSSLQQRIGDDPRLLSNLVRAYSGRAAALISLGRYEDGIAQWQQAADRETGQEQQYLLIRKARAVAIAGDVDTATQEATALLETGTLDAESLFDAARVFAVCRRQTQQQAATDAATDDAANNPKNMPKNNAKNEVTSEVTSSEVPAANNDNDDNANDDNDRHLSLAMKALTMAANRGYFDDVGWEEIDQQTDLRGIQDAAVYKEFVRQRRPPTVSRADETAP